MKTIENATGQPVGVGPARLHAAVVAAIHGEGCPHQNAKATLIAVVGAAVTTVQSYDIQQRYVCNVVNGVLAAAEEAGYADADDFREQVSIRPTSARVDAMAAAIVTSLGGAEKFFGLLEASTMPNSWIGVA